jgi:hypothetical protein
MGVQGGRRGPLETVFLLLVKGGFVFGDVAPAFIPLGKSGKCLGPWEPAEYNVASKTIYGVLS